MPFNLPFFNFPYYNKYNNLYNNSPFINKPHYQDNSNLNVLSDSTSNKQTKEKKYSDEDTSSSEYFFQFLGINLYFDDILLICLLFFLYAEGVKDDELFICLILLLLS